MENQITKQQKSEIALLKTKMTLLQKGWMIFESSVDYWQPFDLLIIHPSNTSRILKIQVKYSHDGFIRNGSTISNRTGNVSKKYSDGDFDYFAVYLPAADVVVFPSIHFRGCMIATEHRSSSIKYYWYEDFLELTDTAEKITREKMNLEPEWNNRQKLKPKFKVLPENRPTKEELQLMLLEMPIRKIGERFGVSGNAVKRWIDACGEDMEIPVHGHWQRIHMDNIRKLAAKEESI